jgi:hypothetical protein
LPQQANEIPPVNAVCACADGSSAMCSDGSRFSNGLLGAWTQNFQNYLRAGAFNNCAVNR